MSTQTLPSTAPATPIVNVEVVHRLIENRVAQLNVANVFETKVATLLLDGAYDSMPPAKKLYALEAVLHEHRVAMAPLLSAGKLLEDIALGG